MNRHERRAAAAKLKAQRHGSVMVLDRTEVPTGACDLCHARSEELRPYGPKGEWVCFPCGMKDEATTAKQYRKHVFGEATH